MNLILNVYQEVLYRVTRILSEITCRIKKYTILSDINLILSQHYLNLARKGRFPNLHTKKALPRSAKLEKAIQDSIAELCPYKVEPGVTI